MRNSFSAAGVTPQLPAVLWISITRTTACALIFVHHYLKTISAISDYTISATIAIAMFLYISGFLARPHSPLSTKWLVSKILKIYVPLLLVLVPLAAVNSLVASKPMNWHTMAIEMLGGALFVERPFYEATWFVTLILGLYCIVFICSKFQRIYYLLLAILLCMYLSLTLILPHAYFIRTIYLLVWFASFYAGNVLSDYGRRRSTNNQSFRNEDAYASNLAFRVSSYALPFYFVHGPILYVVFKIGGLDKELTFSIGLFLSMCCSLFLQRISTSIENRLIHAISPKTSESH